MEYYVRPRHIYFNSRTCTRSSSCRISSSWVAFHVWYLLDCASVHEISSLVIWFQCMSDIFIHYGDIDPLYIFRFHGYSDLFILYVAITTHVIFCIMPIHGYCTLMSPGLLYLLVVMFRVWSWYCTIRWLVLPPVSSSLQFWDGLIMCFSHRITPLISYIRGHLL